MADHSDAIDPRTDITDLFVFQSPGDSDRSVFVLNVFPAASEQFATFDPDASYELKIDTDGDFEADLSFHVKFAAAPMDVPNATVFRSTGRMARGTGPGGEVVIERAPVSVGAEVQITTRDGFRFFAGLRSDPWFADVDGFFNGFEFTGHDTFADRNVLGIVLEAPAVTLGGAAPVGVWARTMAPIHGLATQVDQMGRPLVNAVFNSTDADRSEFNRTPPDRQVAVFLTRFAATLQSFGHREGDAVDLATGLLPDVLPFDPRNAAGYPNGRRLTDDIADLRVSEVTMGRVTADRVEPHTDLLDEFPYLGPPHPISG
ncbi:MAG TPA: DUF4331 family protein [Candidatus Limnocylindrales bacterium]|nr:DUF4331 family protein [Candidatus Limnocylindrales bacterium]